MSRKIFRIIIRRVKKRTTNVRKNWIRKIRRIRRKRKKNTRKYGKTSLKTSKT